MAIKLDITIKLKRYYKLIYIILLSFILRMIWIKQQIHSDEGQAGYYATLLEEQVLNVPLQKGLVFHLFYSVFGISNNPMLIIRMANDVLFLISLVVIYLFAKDLNNGNDRIAIMSTISYGIFMNVPALEGTLALADSVALPFVIFSLYLYYKHTKNKNDIYFICSCLMLSLAILITPLSILGIILILIMMLSAKKKDMIIRNVLFFLIVLILFITLFTIISNYYFYRSIELQRPLLNYLSSQFITISKLKSENLPFGWIFLSIVETLPLLLLSIFGIIMCIRRRNNEDIFLIMWILIFFVYGYNTKSFGHYYLAAIPPASILSGIAISSILDDVYKNIYSLMIVILIISMVISVSFQIRQYSSGCIKWEFVYSCGNLGSYNEQVKLANYLKSYTKEDDPILIHGWMPEIYWYSKHKSPSIIDTATYIPGVNIPQKEYDKIIDQIKKLKFKYIVFRDDFPGGEIAEITKLRYTYVKNIGNVGIYVNNEYDSRSHIYYDFIERLDDAIKEYHDESGETKGLVDDEILTPKAKRIIINNDSRYTMMQHPSFIDSNIIYDNILIQKNMTLEFGIGIDPFVWNKSDGVQFEISIKVNLKDKRKEEVKILSKYLNPKNDLKDRKWYYYDIDLSKYSGKNVDIYFVTRPGPRGDARYDWAYWGNPKLIVKGGSGG